MRLIDADALLQDLKLSKKDLQEIRDGLKYDDEKRICDSEIVTFGECIMRVNNAPTVDIKTEVAREMFAELNKEANLRFDGFRNTIIFPLDYYNKLENKYTKEGDK